MRTWILVSTVALLLSGCSGGSTEGRVAVYRVTGKVTMAGGPISDAMISFAPTNGQPVAVGRSNSDGSFVLTTYDFGDGAAEGKFNVLITKSVATSAPASAESTHAAMASGGGAPASHGSKKKKGGDDGALLNPKYAAVGALDATVSPSGPNDFTFTLDP